jgi:hypothetical protein
VKLFLLEEKYMGQSVVGEPDDLIMSEGKSEVKALTVGEILKSL